MQISGKDADEIGGRYPTELEVGDDFLGGELDVSPDGLGSVEDEGLAAQEPVRDVQSDGSWVEPSGTAGVLKDSARPLRAVSFARSRDSTAAGQAYLRQQEGKNVSLAESMGCAADSVAKLREVGSSSAGERPVVDRLTAMVGRDEVDLVIVESEFRLYRDPWAMCGFVSYCVAHGVELWFSGKEGGIERVRLSLTDAQKKMIRRVYPMAMERERKRLRRGRDVSRRRMYR